MVDAFPKKEGFASEKREVSVFKTYSQVLGTNFQLTIITLQPKTLAAQSQSGSKTLFVGNLSFSIEKADVYVSYPLVLSFFKVGNHLIQVNDREEFFKDCGEIVDVCFATHPDGAFKGFGHVEFATAETTERYNFCDLKIAFLERMGFCGYGY